MPTARKASFYTIEVKEELQFLKFKCEFLNEITSRQFAFRNLEILKRTMPTP
jgi:hypothetical protein